MFNVDWQGTNLARLSFLHIFLSHYSKVHLYLQPGEIFDGRVQSLLFLRYKVLKIIFNSSQLPGCEIQVDIDWFGILWAGLTGVVMLLEIVVLLMLFLIYLFQLVKHLKFMWLIVIEHRRGKLFQSVVEQLALTF